MTPAEPLEPRAEERAAASPDSPPLHLTERRPERVCPNCGAVLYERKCKLLCPEPACGYYMSCSDFY
ncbi:MAG TPA: hypothetical protein VGS00_04540 [Thermoanaerobaculia bacterium]|nr:hypothetical protein [Thermoanaerobaculia bacterium]